MNLQSYDEIFRILLIGLLAASAIFPAYFLVSWPMDKMIKQLEALPDGLRSNRTD